MGLHSAKSKLFKINSNTSYQISDNEYYYYYFNFKCLFYTYPNGIKNNKASYRLHITTDNKNILTIIIYKHFTDRFAERFHRKLSPQIILAFITNIIFKYKGELFKDKWIIPLTNTFDCVFVVHSTKYGYSLLTCYPKHKKL